MRRVKVGIIGTGQIFRRGHLHGYLQAPEAQIVAMQDINKDSLADAMQVLKNAFAAKSEEEDKKGEAEKAKKWREDLDQIKSYQNAEEMMAEEKLELVDICTPPNTHADLAIQALKSGANVMCEKPMAVSYLDCLDVADAVKETGKLYQHNENWLYSPTWYTAKKFIDAGFIGEPLLIFLSYGHGGPESKAWFWKPEISGGGALLDNGIHAITTAWFLAGFERKPLQVKAVAPHGVATRMKKRIIEDLFQDVKVDDDAHIIIEYESMDKKAWITTHIEGSWSEQDGRDTVIIGSNGNISFENIERETYLKIEDPFGNIRKIRTGSNASNTFAGQIKYMCAAVLNNTRPFCDERIGALSSAIVGAAYLSQIRGMKPVTIQEFEDYAFGFKNKRPELIRNLMTAVERK